MSWTNADTRLCRLFDYSYGDRFTKIAKDDSHYKDELSKIFKINKDDWRLEDLRDSVQRLLDEYDEGKNMENIQKLEIILRSVANCLRTKLNYDSKCYQPKTNMNEKTEYEGFFVDVCKELSELYNRYESELNYANKKKQRQRVKMLPDIIREEFSDVFEDCFDRFYVLKKPTDFHLYIIYNNLINGIELTDREKIMLNIELLQNKEYRKANPKRSHNKKYYKIKKFNKRSKRQL